MRATIFDWIGNSRSVTIPDGPPPLTIRTNGFTAERDKAAADLAYRIARPTPKPAVPRP